MLCIGYIEKLVRYPVIPFAGEECDQIEISPSGMDGNILYKFTDESNTTTYSWMKPSDREELHSFKLYKVDKKDNKWIIKIISQEADVYEITDDRLLAYLVGRFNHFFQLINTQHEQQSVYIGEQGSNADNNQDRGVNTTPLPLNIIWKIWPQDKKFLQKCILQIGDKVHISLSPASLNIYKVEVFIGGIIRKGDKINIINRVMSKTL